MVGCDYFTDEDGELEIRFYDYKSGKLLHTVNIRTAFSNHPISVDLVKGRTR